MKALLFLLAAGLLLCFAALCIVLVYLLHELYGVKERRTLTDREVTEALRPIAQVHVNGAHRVSD